ncbi:MAG: hypothetical protein R3E53_07825 [Myxococcota bacterium]
MLLFLLVGWALPWPSAWWLRDRRADRSRGLARLRRPLLALDSRARLRGEPITIERADAEGPERRSFVGETIHWATAGSRRTGRRIASRTACSGRGFLLAAWRLVRAQPGAAASSLFLARGSDLRAVGAVRA